MSMENPMNFEVLEAEKAGKMNEFIGQEAENHIKEHGYSPETAKIDDSEERKAAEDRERANLREALLLEKQNLESELQGSGDGEKERKIQENKDNIEAAKKVLESGKSEEGERKNAAHSIEVLERQIRILEKLL